MRTLRTLRVRDHRLRSVAVRCNRHNRLSASLISWPIMRCGAGTGRRSATRFRSGTAIWAANLSGWTCPSGETRSAISASRRPRATDAIHVPGRTWNWFVWREAIVVCRGMRCKCASAVGAATMRGRGGSRRASRSVSMRRLDTHVVLGASVRSGCFVHAANLCARVGMEAGGVGLGVGGRAGSATGVCVLNAHHGLGVRVRAGSCTGLSAGCAVTGCRRHGAANAATGRRSGTV